MPILHLRGHIARSAFRRATLEAPLQIVDRTPAVASGVFWHFVEVERDPTPAERELLDRLLGEGDTSGGASRGELYVVTPRLGTISPWSSKATDIARNCGLVVVK